jgi:hypothetical protein
MLSNQVPFDPLLEGSFESYKHPALSERLFFLPQTDPSLETRSQLGDCGSGATSFSLLLELVSPGVLRLEDLLG